MFAPCLATSWPHLDGLSRTVPTRTHLLDNASFTRPPLTTVPPAIPTLARGCISSGWSLCRDAHGVRHSLYFGGGGGARGQTRSRGDRGGPIGGRGVRAPGRLGSAPPPKLSRRAPDDVGLLRKAAQVGLGDVGARRDDGHGRGAGVSKRGVAQQRRRARAPHVGRHKGVLPGPPAAAAGVQKCAGQRGVWQGLGSTTACNNALPGTTLRKKDRDTGLPVPTHSPRKNKSRVASAAVAGKKKKERGRENVQVHVPIGQPLVLKHRRRP